MTNRLRFWAVVPAAGVGKRMRVGVPKQYLSLAGRSVLEHTLASLLAVARLDRIMVALAPTDPYWPELAVASDSRIATTAGGKERADSVLAGLRALAEVAHDEDWVLVHDAARPCLKPEDAERLIESLCDDPVGGILALPSVDTLKEVADGRIGATLDRSRVWRALTPQMFRYRVLRDALEKALAAEEAVTDESAAVEWAGLRPRIVEGSPDNIKITRPEDLPLAEFYLERR
ncbi:2-C-methyl-D-erythritol 4-phosphate cytidylyltransferase [Methylohalobius crimeensis]|uniref:2-C-methyl-D-erythritol 4-phosphate cytidylyltransferase n=1 Tax=Methylohalobius crimeensis TaxID=244365 RepID=UPI0003B7B67D|nr:2-C-methyl-D-erythritol 4-phosphate cytidylyltransferase [Methylohalobius crimeensis]